MRPPPPKPTTIDRFFLRVAPQYGLQRMLAKHKAQWFYEGGSSSRARKNPSSLQASESSRQFSDRMWMMRTARDLAENVGFVKSILLKVATYAVGSINYQAQTDDDAINDQYEEYFADWCNVCDITGRHTFQDLTMLVVFSMLRDGDVGAEWVRRDGFFPALNMIEADRIGGTSSYGIGDNNCGGVKIDSWGRPIAYQVYNRSKEGMYDSPRDVPAESFVHVFDPHRVDQYRGVTAFHAALTTLQDIHEILENEKMAVKWASAQGGVIESETGEDASGYDFDTSTTDSNDETLRTKAIEAGALNYINPGESFKAFEYNRPSPAFQGLLDMLYREVALALNLPFGFVYDLSKLGGPSARLESAQAQRSFARIQTVITNKWLNRIKNMVLADGIERKMIPFHARYMKGRWQFPAHPTIDVGRESAANLGENRQGIKTMAQICGENGQDWQEVIVQLGREAKMRQDIAAEMGVEPTEIRLLTPNMPAPAADPKQPTAGKPPAKEEEGEEDDKEDEPEN